MRNQSTRRSTYRPTPYASNAGLAVLAFACVLTFALIGAIAGTLGASPHRAAYAYALAHGLPSYALIGDASGNRDCSDNGTLTYSRGGPFLCDNTGRLIPDPYQ